MPSNALHRRAFVAAGIGGLLLAACATTASWTKSCPLPQDPPLRPVLGMNKHDVSTTLQPWVTAGSVTWYDAETLQPYPGGFGSVPNLARCTLQSPLAEWPAGGTDWNGVPANTPIRVVMSTSVPCPDFRGMRVSDARIRAANAGLSLRFYGPDEVTEVSPPEHALVQQNVSMNPAGSKIDVGGTVGLVIVGHLFQGGGEVGDDGGGD